jgi:hypothetical protein
VDKNDDTSDLAALMLHLAAKTRYTRQLSKQAIKHARPCLDRLVLPEPVTRWVLLLLCAAPCWALVLPEPVTRWVLLPPCAAPCWALVLRVAKCSAPSPL